MAGVGGISGLVTGLDTVDLISKMLDLERRPIYNLEEKIASNLDLKSAYEMLEANLMALKIDSRRLLRRDLFKTIGAASSNEDIMTARVNGTPATGQYTLSVSQLAQSHQIASGEFSDKDETSVGTGTITIQTGTASPVEITVDSSNNTLEKVAEAINNSSAGVQAVLVNVGGEDAAYKLLISGGSTGEVNQIVIDEDLSGGTGLQLGTVGSVSNLSGFGATNPASAGNYTGSADATFTFTVAAGGGGTIGTDTVTLNYSDGGSISGTVTIPSSYTAGSTVSVYGGLELSFDAGSVSEGDSFTVDVGSSTIQAAANAVFTLGSSMGGGTPVQLESATNTVTGLIDNVTLELHKADADSQVVIDVAVDTESMAADVEKFVNRYSEVVKFFNNHFKYDADLGTGGELFGENFAIRLNQSIRQKVTDVVQGLGQQLTSLAALGIKTGSDGTLSVDGTELRDAIKNDPDSLVRLFSTSGTSTDADIQFLIASSETQSSYMYDEEGYEIEITVAASKARYLASSITDPSEAAPLVIDATNNTFNVNLDGNETGEIAIASGSYTSGEELAEAMEDAINSDNSIGNSSMKVEYVDDGGGTGHLEFTSTQYGSVSSIEFQAVSGNGIYADLGVTAGALVKGTDVAGTINGEAATGSGRYLTGGNDAEYTNGLQVLVTITADQLAVQGSSQGRVTVSKGVATRITEYLTELTDLESGALVSKKNGLESMNETMEDAIEQLRARISKKETRLFNDFVMLETVISQFQAEENYMTSMITQLQQVTNYRAQSR